MSNIELVQRVVRAHVLRIAQATEQALERALQHGQYGVLTLTTDDGTFLADEHPHVPYGQLYEARSNATSVYDLVREFTTWRPAEPSLPSVPWPGDPEE